MKNLWPSMRLQAHNPISYLLTCQSLLCMGLTCLNAGGRFQAWGTTGTPPVALELVVEDEEPMLESSLFSGQVLCTKKAERPEYVFEEVSCPVWLLEPAKGRMTPYKNETQWTPLGIWTCAHLTGKNDLTYWRVQVKGKTMYVDRSTLTDSEETMLKAKKQAIREQTRNPEWSGAVLSRSAGSIIGPSGKETYYNLPMGGVVQIMRNAGYSAENYPYWVRTDGCKMLGDYIMVAADLYLRPRGTILDCSLGKALVCDTGTFAASNQRQLDIAVTW